MACRSIGWVRASRDRNATLAFVPGCRATDPMTSILSLPGGGLPFAVQRRVLDRSICTSDPASTLIREARDFRRAARDSSERVRARPIVDAFRKHSPSRSCWSPQVGSHRNVGCFAVPYCVASPRCLRARSSSKIDRTCALFGVFGRRCVRGAVIATHSSDRCRDRRLPHALCLLHRSRGSAWPFDRARCSR